MMKKSVIGKFSIILTSILVALVLFEFLFRLALFSKNPKFQKFRNPGLYADYFSEDDYWKLYYIFDGKYKPPESPHHKLGWVGNFSREDYLHNDSSSLKGRRSILFYGDSYAQCSEGNVICFESFLSNDKYLNKVYYLLNYGVGGYGLDQIFLLFKNTIKKYEKPFVVFSFMVLDLDRSILTVRVGQKPLFIINNNELQLSETAIYKNPDDYYYNNPPQIKSYIYRKIVYGNILPLRIKSILKNEKNYIADKVLINKKILDETSRILSENNTDFVFLVFHTHWPGVSSLDKLDWRDDFLINYFEEHNLPFIWSREIIDKDMGLTNKDYTKYIDPDNGHPTTYLNELIYTELKKNLKTN